MPDHREQWQGENCGADNLVVYLERFESITARSVREHAGRISSLDICLAADAIGLEFCGLWLCPNLERPRYPVGWYRAALRNAISKLARRPRTQCVGDALTEIPDSSKSEETQICNARRQRLCECESRILEKLTPRQRNLYKELLSAPSYACIARKLDIDRHDVRRAAAGIIKKVSSCMWGSQSCDD